MTFFQWIDHLIHQTHFVQIIDINNNSLVLKISIIQNDSPVFFHNGGCFHIFNNGTTSHPIFTKWANLTQFDTTTILKPFGIYKDGDISTAQLKLCLSIRSSSYRR